MNKRFKELAIQSKLLTGWPVGEMEYETYAQSIVRECQYVILMMDRPLKERQAYNNALKEYFNLKDYRPTKT